MVLHFGKTCFCLIIFPKKKTLQFTLFFVAILVFGGFFVKHQEKKILIVDVFLSFRFGRTFFWMQKEKVLNKRQNDKKKE